MDQETFARSNIGPMVELCPCCRWASRYEARDYYFHMPS